MNPLMIPDLFCGVLDSLSPAFAPENKRALAALALTCRAFTEPSLDRLWRKLYSLTPLIRCYTSLDNVIPPTPSQLTVIDRYSHRIRQLTVYDTVSVRFLQCTSMRPGVLLPNLTVLTWSPPYFATPHVPIVFIQRLLSPTLVSLNATLAEADGPTLLSFLDIHPLLCRNIKSLEFHFAAGTHTEPTIQALSRAICSHRSLEKFYLHAPIDGITLSYLSTLGTLRELSVTLSERSWPHRNTLMRPLFRDLDVLEFVTWDLDLVTSLLQPHDQKFHTFRLYHRGRQTQQAILTFLIVLTSRPRTTPLRELALSFGDFSHPFPADQMASEATRYCLCYETLQPLTMLSSLCELTFEWSEQISLDDDELAKLVRSWPSLRVFYIYCGRGGYSPFSTKYATLRGLLSLVNACPELYTVSLPLDVRQVPEAKEADACETNFTCLIVPESPIEQALPVATFLFAHLPRVTAVDAKFLRPPGADVSQIMAYEKAWQRVELHLEKLHYSFVDPLGSDSDVSDN